MNAVPTAIELSFKSFFRRVKNGETPGYPRFKGIGWYKSFTYPQVGFKLDGSKLTLYKIDSIRIFRGMGGSHEIEYRILYHPFISQE